MRTLVETGAGHWPAGEHQVVWNGRTESGAPAASGIYFAILRTPVETRSGKLILLP